MEHNRKHTALEIRDDVCIGCSHCIKVCPTEALRVSGGKALMYADWCIDCGECFRVCPSRAIRVVDDDMKQIFDYEYRVLLVPAVFFAQFDDSIPREMIYDILGDLGFSEICLVEQSVDSQIDEINQYIAGSEEAIISSYCPAVLRLIQVRFPALVDRIMMLRPPIEITAQYYKQKFKGTYGSPHKLGIFYLTPCIAKIAAIKSCIGGYDSPINGVINMDYIYNRVLMAYKNKAWDKCECTVNSALSSKGALWPTTGGESKYINGRTLAIDGMDNVIDFLEKFEDDEITGVDFLELRGCDESCAGGILVQGNRFLIADHLRKLSETFPENHDLVEDYKKYCSGQFAMSMVEPRSMVKYDKDITVAIKKMEAAHMLKEFLPGIDCGACGAPSCEALAADIVREDASVNNCIFMQARFEKEGSLSSTESIELMEKVWGKDRFVNKESIKE